MPQPVKPAALRFMSQPVTGLRFNNTSWLRVGGSDDQHTSMQSSTTRRLQEVLSKALIWRKTTFILFNYSMCHPLLNFKSFCEGPDVSHAHIKGCDLIMNIRNIFCLIFVMLSSFSGWCKVSFPPVVVSTSSSLADRQSHQPARILPTELLLLVEPIKSVLPSQGCISFSHLHCPLTKNSALSLTDCDL